MITQLSLAATATSPDAQITELHEFYFPLQSDWDLYRFVQQAFGVRLPHKKICENHTTPFRAFADAYFARSPIMVIRASRGLGGKTWILSLLSLTEAITLKANISLLGGSGEQSKRALEAIRKFWKYRSAPRHLMLGDVAREMRFAWGNQIEALMASQTSVRGPHPQRVRMDEVDEMNLEILDAALGQAMSSDGIPSHIVQSSTHQHADGTMTECIRRAAANGHPVYEWCYKETLQPHGWLAPAEVERKKSQTPDAIWNNEVELQEPNPESRAIMSDKVSQMFRRDLGEYAGELRQYIESEAPQSNAKYCHGADWARDVNWTIIWTLRYDVNPARFIAFERMGRESYPAMVGRLKDRIKRFGGATAHDATGLGKVVEDLLTGVHSLKNFDMVGNARANLLSDYIKAIENQEIIAPFIRFAEQEHRMASRQDVYAGGRGHLPDTISAGALCWHARNSGGWARGMGSQ